MENYMLTSKKYRGNCLVKGKTIEKDVVRYIATIENFEIIRQNHP